MDEDLAGIELARLFYLEAVAPLVARAVPGLRHTAGRFGHGSDVLALDDRISRDHGWGPRCELLLADNTAGEIFQTVDATLREHLPPRFRGYSTSYREWVRVDVDGPPIDHRVEIASPRSYLSHALGTATVTGWSAVDWLIVPQQRLLEVTSGQLFRDDLDFAQVRRTLSFYPDDLRLHLIAAEWKMIGEEQAFLGRAGARGDEVGSALVAARLAESLMRLTFYLEGRYAPYAKWLGSAFRRLAGGGALPASIALMLSAATWQERDRYWVDGLAEVIAMHERHGLLVPGRYIPAEVYSGRPGRGLPQFDRDGLTSVAGLIKEIRKQIVGREVFALPPDLGSLDQISRCPDQLYAHGRRPALAGLHLPAPSSNP
jgi:hypothetical protein